jgi:predicted alpha/beta superfamily hydrolase
MRTFRRLCLGLTIAAIPAMPTEAVSQTPGRDFPAVTIPGTEVRSLRSQVTSRAYDLYVYVPSKWTAGTRYPVLYLLDGQWDFKLLTSIQGGLLYDKFVPDVIIVGITYSGPNANYDSLRAVDYTPKASPSNPGSGQGAKFLSFLETELIPFVESNYPADPARRALMGASLGGLFTLYAMYTSRASSPAMRQEARRSRTLSVARSTMRQRMRRVTRSCMRSCTSRSATREPLYQPVQELVRKIRARSYSGLTVESRVIAGERHSGTSRRRSIAGCGFSFRRRRSFPISKRRREEDRQEDHARNVCSGGCRDGRGGLCPHGLAAGGGTASAALALIFIVVGIITTPILWIYGMVDAVVRGGGQLVSFHAREADLAAEFARKYPVATQVGDERAILEDSSLELVLSAITPNERAPLGIRVMQHGKDFMVDKPGATSLAQLADVRRVQSATKRIYSVVYSERFENGATIRAGELVREGTIGR